jgi:hypothetical protein
MSELILHLFGDYVTQSDWMASEKTKRHLPALSHAVVYSLPFLLLGPSMLAFAVILGTHFLIDRYRLARYVAFGKNYLAPSTWWFQWADCAGTGYHKDRPAWLAVWLMIAADNTLHLAINHLSLMFL